MTKTFPTDAKTRLLICDDVRPEIGGKLSILGFYPGGSITITTEPNTPPVISSLCLMWSFIDGEGEFTAQISVSDPNGKKIIDGPPAPAEKKIDGDLNLIIKMAPFIFNAFGTYKCCVTLDGEMYEREFKLVDAAVSLPEK